jgi:hypothetical protein
MNVTVKEFGITMEIKNKGIEFEVHDGQGSKHKGDLVLNKAGLTWCKGKRPPKNGRRIRWKEFIEWAETQ